MVNKFLILICFQMGSYYFSQLKLEIKEVSYEKYKFLVPQHYISLQEDLKKRGHVFEIILTNESNSNITIPIDTCSYALPFTDKLNIYYLRKNLIIEPDKINSLGIYGFVYQSDHFLEGGYGDVDFFDEETLFKLNNIEIKRKNKINEWSKENNNFDNDTIKVYNWYLNKNMVNILPKKSIKFKIYFNPRVKMQQWYSIHESYYGLDLKQPYNLTFKIITNNNLYKLLTKKQRKNYKNLYIGIVESNTLKINAPDYYDITSPK